MVKQIHLLSHLEINHNIASKHTKSEACITKKEQDRSSGYDNETSSLHENDGGEEEGSETVSNNQNEESEIV